MCERARSLVVDPEGDGRDHIRDDQPTDPTENSRDMQAVNPIAIQVSGQGPGNLTRVVAPNGEISDFGAGVIGVDRVGQSDAKDSTGIAGNLYDCLAGRAGRHAGSNAAESHRPNGNNGQRPLYG